MMKNHTKTVGALAAATAMVTGYALAGEPAPPPPMEPAPTRSFFEGEVHVGYNSMYEFRFVDLGQDMAEAGADIAFDLGGGWGISAGAWYASTNDTKAWGRGAGSFNELDLYAGVGYEFDWMDIELGYIFYHYPDKTFNGVFWQSTDTQELYLSVGFDLPWELELGATWYYDFQRYNGSYWDVNLSRSFEFTDCLSLDVTAGLGFAKGTSLQLDGQSARWFLASTGSFYAKSLDGYQGWYASVALPWEFAPNVTLTPYIKYTDGASDLLTNTTDITTGQDYFFGGVLLSVAF